MGKIKIKRGLSDQEMVGQWQETASFEHCSEETPVKQPPVAANKKEKETFLTPELADKISKEMLALKVDLFKQGILDYDFKVTRSGSAITLTAVPRAVKSK